MGAMMTGTEKISGRILDQAQAQAREIIENARGQADAAYARAQAQAQEQAAQIVANAQREARENAARAMAAAESTLRKEMLRAKRGVIDETFIAAERALSALDDKRFTTLYHALVMKALTKGEEGIAPAAADAHRLGAAFVDGVNTALKQRGTAAVKALPPREAIAGGLVVVDGDMEIDLSVRSVLQEVRERAEGEVAQVLFAFLEG